MDESAGAMRCSDVQEFACVVVVTCWRDLTYIYIYITSVGALGLLGYIGVP